MNEEQEDFNAFNSWDCFGATLLLAIVPAVMYFVFTMPKKEDMPHEGLAMSITIGVVGVLISLLVLALALITRWRIIGKLVNGAGNILTPVYIVIAVCAWWPDEEAEAPAAQQQQQTAPGLTTPPAPEAAPRIPAPSPQ